MNWSRLLKRVVDIDMRHCPNCGGGGLKIIAAVLERQVIETILTPWGWIRSRRPGAERARRGKTKAT
jgi:hypothetical protein